MFLGWDPVPKPLILPPNEVHVLCANLATDEERVRQLARSLSADELSRSKRFRFERDRRRYAVGRGTLREILGAYLGASPALLAFAYGSHGKPSLAANWNRPGIRFSVSHCEDVALYALAVERSVGVDLERIRGDVDILGIAEKFFSPREFRELQLLPQRERTEAFFRCWTRREAYLKAKGTGLGPTDFEVSLDQRPTENLLHHGKGRPQTESWALRTVDMDEDHVGAVAAQGRGWHLRCWRWRQCANRNGATANAVTP